jgi:hypothetical protein
VRIENLEGDVEEIKDDVDGLNAKIGNIKFSGDTLFRIEGKYNSNDTQVQRGRFRFRLSADAPVNDQFSFHARLASGTTNNPTSALDNYEHEFEQKNFWLERAYLVWTPPGAKDWKFFAGKFSPNWKNTLITFDSDVGVEGLGQSYKDEDGLVFNIAEMIPDQKGFYIVAQVGKENLLTDGLNGYVTYHYINDAAWQFIEQKLRDGDLKNTMALDRIDMDNYAALEILGSYMWDTGSIPVTITGNYILNLGDDALEDMSGLQQGAWLELKLNNAKEVGDTDGWFEYGKLQANSVLSFLTDAARGSDCEFIVGGVKYKWMKNFDIVFRFVYCDRLSVDSNFKMFHLDFLNKL